jgi:hypothetical protein
MTRFFQPHSFQRVRTQFPATISGPGGTYEARVVDLSPRGVQLDVTNVEPKSGEAKAVTAAVLFEGAMTSIEFDLPADMGTIQAFARVRWRSGEPCVFRAEFIEPNKETRAKIADYIAYHGRTISTLNILGVE